MGIPVYYSEDTLSELSDSATSCACACNSNNCSSNTTNPPHNEASNCKSNTQPNPEPTATNVKSSSSMSDQAYRDIVGNCKEMRIKENTNNLRIVGNGNRIRIAINTGNIIVIGNNTILKIRMNHGELKYTGNNGRIALGCQSTQQLVDYIGCNGILKICTSKKTSDTNKQYSSSDMGSKSPEAENDTDKNAGNTKAPTPPSSSTADSSKTTTKPSINTGAKPKEKSRSFGGYSCASQWKTFESAMSSTHSNKSMPNLKMPLECKRQQPQSIIQTVGNIVISNASNICITPQVRNIAMHA